MHIGTVAMFLLMVSTIFCNLPVIRISNADPDPEADRLSTVLEFLVATPRFET
jgi:hypothetical protein